MKSKKLLIIGIVIIFALVIVGVITKYIDSGRVTTNHEPKFCIKTVSNNGSKVTYWGLGYKVIRYVGVSPNEPYESNIGVKMGSWFMKYELPEVESIEIEYEGQTVTITNIKDIGTIENILINSKYNNELCAGINTHKITLNNDIYYIKESCKEIQKGDKQAKITDEDLENINNIISSKIENEQNKDEYSFYGKVVKSDKNHIIVEPNENEEIRKSGDKVSIGLGKDNDVIYPVGTNVKITYDGMVMTTYPLQINTIKIETKSAENFEILFYDKHPMESYKIYTILDKSETDKYDYTIYGYDGSVNIRIDGKDYSLKEALLENKITMEEIIAKADKDLKEKKINKNEYQDGGSMRAMIYQYNDYTIIKFYEDENRDVYIGNKTMTIDDVI